MGKKQTTDDGRVKRISVESTQGMKATIEFTREILAQNRLILKAMCRGGFVVSSKREIEYGKEGKPIPEIG